MKIYKAKLVPAQSNIDSDKNQYLRKSIEFYNVTAYDSSLVYLHKVYAIEKTDYNLYLYYGLNYKDTGRLKRAESALQKSLHLCGSSNSKRAEIYLALAELELLKGDIQKAKQNYLTVLQLQPESTDALDALLNLDDSF